jgi:hypothetical protein
MSRGVTANEFAAMCQERMPKALPTRFARDSAQPFLDRCCDLGLVRREDGDGMTRYAPTPALRRVVAMWGAPDA